jgi:hypothetical protein
MEELYEELFIRDKKGGVVSTTTRENPHKAPYRF